MRRIEVVTRDPLVQKLVSLLLAELPEGGEATVLLDAALMERMPEFKGCRVILFTASADPQYLTAAKAAGADGLWYLQPSGAGLEEAVLGKKPFPEKAPPVRLGQICADDLTPREMEVLRQVTLGKRDADIAGMLACAVSTVKHHLSMLREKTGIDSRVGLAVQAVKTGLIDVRPEAETEK